MSMPVSGQHDVNCGTSIFIGCWILTGFVGLILASRYSVKAWMHWIMPKVSRTDHLWGGDDFFYLMAFAFDVSHMILIWKSWQWGLGRHSSYLTMSERTHAMMWSFISQPLAIAAATCSRTGVIIFLYNCLAQNNRRIKWIIVVCGLLQIVVNLFTIMQIILQCGPSPYRLTDRAAYFHYMWDPLPDDGTVRCQMPTVQALTGYVQGAFNSLVDFTLAYLAALEIWQIIFRAPISSGNNRKNSWTDHFRQLDYYVRKQRIWQTILLCGPLLLSGVASIVKTYLLSALGSRLDFMWDIVPFILWVKIENASIPIATCGPVLRLFMRTCVGRHRHSATARSCHDPQSKRSRQAFELNGRSEAQNNQRSNQTNSRSEVLRENSVQRALSEFEFDSIEENGSLRQPEPLTKADFDVSVEERAESP